MNPEQLGVEEKEFCSLFSLEPQDILKIAPESINKNLYMRIRLVPHQGPCPDCNYTPDKPHIHAVAETRIEHSLLTSRRCKILYERNRFKCPLCGRTYYEGNPFVSSHARISNLTVNNILDDLKNPSETFTSVAGRHHISPTSAASIFDMHVHMARLPLPKVLSFDEVYAFRSEKSKYVCVLLDFITQEPVDLLPDRYKDNLIAYFNNIPLKERDNVQFCCFDMYKTYRDVMKTCMKSRRGCVDRFHMAKDLNGRLDQYRIQVMRSCNRDDQNTYWLLKKFGWLLLKRQDEKDRGGERLFARDRRKIRAGPFKKSMNYYEIREKIFEINPDIRPVWQLKEDVIAFYETNTAETAAAALDSLIEKFRTSKILKVRKFAETLSTWKEEILNSFEIVDARYEIDKATGVVSVQGIRSSSSVIERKNGTIKLVKKAACGYGSWKRFRNRCLYVLRSGTDGRLTCEQAAKIEDRKYREKRKKELEALMESETVQEEQISVDTEVSSVNAISFSGYVLGKGEDDQ